MALHSRSDSLATREQILAAAVRLITQNGPSALTIDGVAKVANMSKGGVLYHFPSKDSLFLELVKNGLKDNWCEMRRFWKADPEPRGRWHRAWILTSFSALRKEQKQGMPIPALIATVLTDARLQAILSRFRKRMRNCLAFDGLNPVWSGIIQSSVLGARLDAMFNHESLTGERLDIVEAHTLRLLQGLLDNHLVFEQ